MTTIVMKLSLMIIKPTATCIITRMTTAMILRVGLLLVVQVDVSIKEDGRKKIFNGYN